MNVAHVRTADSAPTSRMPVDGRQLVEAAKGVSESDGAGRPTSSSRESVGITILRKALDAAQLALQRAQNNGGDEQAVQNARQRVVDASTALANALIEQAKQARSGSSPRSRLDTYV